MARPRKAARIRAALVTGFEPFGGHGLNPSAEIARRLDGTTIAGTRVVGRVLPVDLARLDGAIADILRAIDPVAVIALGLAAGEPVIRLERVALNLASFEIPDNAGRIVRDQPLEPGGPAALPARLDLAAIRRALFERGIPVRLSSTAGLYLCNAAMYRFLRATPARVPCGFIHLPLLRAQVAMRLEASDDDELGRLASMEFPTMRRAVEVALQTTLAAASRRRSATA